MAVKVDLNLCRGCGRKGEPPCMRVCPGDLFSPGTDGGVVLRDPARCWDCAACIKACPYGAIFMYLPPAIGGRGSTLQAEVKDDRIIWRIRRPDGREETITTARGKGREE